MNSIIERLRQAIEFEKVAHPINDEMNSSLWLLRRGYHDALQNLLNDLEIIAKEYEKDGRTPMP